MTGSRADVFAALKLLNPDTCGGKDSGFYVKGEGFVSLAQARKRTGISAPPREYKPRIGAWGDYATVAMLNRPRA